MIRFTQHCPPLIYYHLYCISNRSSSNVSPSSLSVLQYKKRGEKNKGLKIRVVVSCRGDERVYRETLDLFHGKGVLDDLLTGLFMCSDVPGTHLSRDRVPSRHSDLMSWSDSGLISLRGVFTIHSSKECAHTVEGVENGYLLSRLDRITGKRLWILRRSF